MNLAGVPAKDYKIILWRVVRNRREFCVTKKERNTLHKFSSKRITQMKTSHYAESFDLRQPQTLGFSEHTRNSNIAETITSIGAAVTASSTAIASSSAYGSSEQQQPEPLIKSQQRQQQPENKKRKRETDYYQHHQHIKFNSNNHQAANIIDHGRSI